MINAVSMSLQVAIFFAGRSDCERIIPVAESFLSSE